MLAVASSIPQRAARRTLSNKYLGNYYLVDSSTKFSSLASLAQNRHHRGATRTTSAWSSSMRFSLGAIALASTTSFSSTTLQSSSYCHALSTMALPTKVQAESPLASLTLDNSWPRELSPETPENLQKSRDLEHLTQDNDDNNRTKRPVFNGHYVLVPPTGLDNPQRILVSQDVAQNLLGLTSTQVESEDFLKVVSGNLVLGETWATPYALSIMGTRYTSNCPYGTGNGYGDGRAVSIAEFNGYELQLKGAGKTPFHRGADGRAVLRSSIREFLASEAMHYLGVETTRALSLIRGSNRVQRPWYSDDAVLKIPDMDDVRLAQYSEGQRRQIIQQLRATQKADPNVMISEPCAITCRVATSFTRIGHLDHFARRAEQASVKAAEATGKRFATDTLEWKELEELIWHACKREFKAEAYDPFVESKNIAGAAEKLLELSAGKIATMVANWIRVGFAQGNFNADNCLVGGKTMDYGPFGFMEEYTPLFAKWTGSGQHFGFLNQATAGFVNFQVLAESVAPVIAAARGEDTIDKVTDDALEKAQHVFNDALDAAVRSKLGLPADADAAEDLWEKLKELMGNARVDWTIFWRQLTYVMRDYPDLESEDYEEMMTLLEKSSSLDSESGAFYESLSPEARRQWIVWIKDWREIVKAASVDSTKVFETMRTSNPKYVLREWMLVDAYSTAADEDYEILKELYELVKHPYDEGTSDQAKNYYKRAPASASERGGTAFMS